MIRLPNWLYDVGKYCVLVLFPASTSLYVGLCAIFHFPYAKEVAETSALVCTFLGTILHISSKNYWEEVSEAANENTEI